MSTGRLTIALLAASIGTACGGSNPPSPSPGGGSGETITGTERIGWTQRAADAGQLSTFQYAIYVDGVRNEARDATCGTAPGSNGYGCSAKLPPMSAGLHTLEVAAYINDGGIVESARSVPLQVTVRAVTAPAVEVGQKPSSIAAGDGLVLTRSDVVSGLEDPVDFAVAPDSRLFIAERAGRILIARRGELDASAALVVDDLFLRGANGGVLALALDPDFARTRFVYLLQAADGRAGPVFRMSRYREVGGLLGERAVLFDRQPAASARPAGTLRFGPDGKLYVLLDDGGERSSASRAATFNGKLLRLNADGTTPADARAGNPVVAGEFARPGGLDWQPGTGRPWAVDAGAVPPTLRALATERPDGASFALPLSAGGSMVFYRGPVESLAGSLLIASPARRELTRVRMDAADGSRVAAVETLLADADIRAVGGGPDGRLYLATGSEIWALDR